MRHPHASVDEGQRRRYERNRDGIRVVPWRPGIRKPAEFDFAPLPMDLGTRICWAIVGLAIAYFAAQLVRGVVGG